MSDFDLQIEAIEKEIRETPYHKGTEHHIGKLRARLARLKDRVIESEFKSKGGGGGGGYAVKKQGDATVILVGPPSVGKSTLVNKLTNANSKIAPYAFTTVSVIPGMMVYKNARIQILDVPGLIEGAEEGKGRGREVLSVARASDLLIIITEIGKLDAFDRISKALERNGIRINKTKPDVVVDKKLSGGIILHSNIKQEIGKDTIKEIAQEFSIKNGEINLKEKVSIERLIDAFSPSRAYIPGMFVANKIDLLEKKNEIEFDSQKVVLISAEKSINLDFLREEIWKRLKLVRIYLVKPDEEPNFEDPIIMKSGETLEDVIVKLGTRISENTTRAKIWGTGSKFQAQEVSLSMQVQEGMQVRFI